MELFVLGGPFPFFVLPLLPSGTAPYSESDGPTRRLKKRRGNNKINRMCTFAMAACCTQTVAAHRVLSGSMTCTARVAAKATSLACPFRLISGRVSLHARALFGVAVFCLARWVLLKDPSKQGRHHYNMLVGSSDRALLTHTTCAPRHHLVIDIELFLCLCVYVSFNPKTPHSFPTQTPFSHQKLLKPASHLYCPAKADEPTTPAAMSEHTLTAHAAPTFLGPFHPFTGTPNM